MRKLFTVLMFLVFYANISMAQCQNPEFEKLLKKNLKASVSQISVKEAYKNYSKYTVLDAREYKEYQVSHLKNAKHIGFEKFKIQSLSDIKKDSPILVYCSIGVRSEIIGEKLKAAGYTKVYNLYGSIFEWVNEGQPVYNSKNQITTKVHAYDKEWGIWLEKGEKVY